MALFTLAQARLELARLRPVRDEIMVVRADAAELAAALAVGRPSTGLGGLPEWKATEARLDDLMTEVQQTGAELMGLAPLLIDFSADLDGVPVLLCWLENEPELAWYHLSPILASPAGVDCRDPQSRPVGSSVDGRGDDQWSGCRRGTPRTAGTVPRPAPRSGGAPGWLAGSPIR